MESGTENDFSKDAGATGNNDRRDFLNALVAAALMAAASETANAQQAAGAQKAPARGGMRQPLPAPFTDMDAAFASLTIRCRVARVHCRPNTRPLRTS